MVKRWLSGFTHDHLSRHVIPCAYHSAITQWFAQSCRQGHTIAATNPSSNAVHDDVLVTAELEHSTEMSWCQFTLSLVYSKEWCG